MSKTETAEAATNGAAAAKVADLGLLEEDDEFEEFPAEDEGTEEVEQARVWEDNWDDDTIEDDFSNQLRNMSSEETAPMSRSPPPLTPPPSKKRCVQTTPPPTKTPSKQDKTESRSSNGTATNGNSTENNHSAKNGSSTPTRGRRARGSSSSQRNGTSSPEPAAPSTPTRASTRLRQTHTYNNRFSLVYYIQVFMVIMVVFIGMSYCNAMGVTHIFWSHWNWQVIVCYNFYQMLFKSFICPVA